MDTKGAEWRDTLSFSWKDDTSGWRRLAFLLEEGKTGDLVDRLYGFALSF